MLSGEEQKNKAELKSEHLSCIINGVHLGFPLNHGAGAQKNKLSRRARVSGRFKTTSVCFFHVRASRGDTNTSSAWTALHKIIHSLSLIYVESPSLCNQAGTLCIRLEHYYIPFFAKATPPPRALMSTRANFSSYSSLCCLKQIFFLPLNPAFFLTRTLRKSSV